MLHYRPKVPLRPAPGPAAPKPPPAVSPSVSRPGAAQIAAVGADTQQPGTKPRARAGFDGQRTCHSQRLSGLASGRVPGGVPTAARAGVPLGSSASRFEPFRKEPRTMDNVGAIGGPLLVLALVTAVSVKPPSWSRRCCPAAQAPPFPPMSSPCRPGLLC